MENLTLEKMQWITKHQQEQMNEMWYEYDYLMEQFVYPIENDINAWDSYLQYKFGQNCRLEKDDEILEQVYAPIEGFNWLYRKTQTRGIVVIGIHYKLDNFNYLDFMDICYEIERKLLKLHKKRVSRKLNVNWERTRWNNYD
jgi:hypothetical protein